MQFAAPKSFAPLLFRPHGANLWGAC
jgi:hypothetical protein